MKITFLGTGTSQGVPVIACKCEVCTSDDLHDKRLRSSILVQDGSMNIVVDSGPDFRQQMLRCGITTLDALLFTHSHKDHIAGMDDIRAFNFVNQKAVDVYAEEATLQALKREFYYVFAEEKYPGIPDVSVHLINDKPFSIGELPVIPVRVFHYKMPVLGFRFGDFTYITDANYISEEEKKKIKGSRVLVLNALRKGEHISHFNLQQAIDLIQELAPEKAFLTHISHQLGTYGSVSPELPPNIYLAYDQLEITL